MYAGGKLGAVAMSRHRCQATVQEDNMGSGTWLSAGAELPARLQARVQALALPMVAMARDAPIATATRLDNFLFSGFSFCSLMVSIASTFKRKESATEGFSPFGIF